MTDFGVFVELAGVMAGETPLASALARRLLLKRDDDGPATGKDSGQRELTGRQTELLQLLAEGMTYKEMAVRLTNYARCKLPVII